MENICPNPTSLESNILTILNLERIKKKACILNEDFYSNAILENMINSGESLSQSDIFSRNNFFCPQVDFLYLECEKNVIFNKKWNNDNLKMANEILSYSFKIQHEPLMDKKYTHIGLRFSRNDAYKTAKLYVILTVKLIIIEEIIFENEVIKLNGVMNDGNLMVSSIVIIDEKNRNLLVIGCERILLNQNEKSFRVNFMRAPFTNGDFHLEFYCCKGWENLTYGNNFDPNVDFNRNVPIIGDLKLRVPLIPISKKDYKSVLKSKNGEIKRNGNMLTYIRQNSPYPKLFNRLSTLASIENNPNSIFENERPNSLFNTQVSPNAKPNLFFSNNENKMYTQLNQIQQMETEPSPKIDSKNLNFSISNKIFDNIKDGLQIFDKSSKFIFSPLKSKNIQNEQNLFDANFSQKKNNPVFYDIPINNNHNLNEKPDLFEQNIGSNKQAIKYFNPFQSNSNNRSAYFDCSFNKNNENNFNKINHQEKPASPIFFSSCPANNNNNHFLPSDKNLNFSEFSLKNSPKFFNERSEIHNMQTNPQIPQNIFENNFNLINDSMVNNFNSMPFCDSYTNFSQNNLSIQSLPNFLPPPQEQANILQTNNFTNRNIISENEQHSLACNFNNLSNLQPNFENKNASSLFYYSAFINEYEYKNKNIVHSSIINNTFLI